jgi:hypothetical protein
MHDTLHPTRRGLIAGLALLATLPIVGGPALAQSLDGLRAGGQVAERYDGLAVARSNDPATRQLVDEVNAQRRQIYAKRAAEQGVPADQVARVYAAEIFKNAPPGTYFVQENGQTVRK